MGNESGFLVPYEYLHQLFSENWRWLFYVLILVWIVALFYSMYAIADRHFTWALEHLSQLCRLSPDMAGLTLLAFGNGAPDFFTAVFGAGDEPEMILGSSVGSGLFIVTVIFGLVLLVARRPGQGRTTIRPDGKPEESAPLPEIDTGLFRCLDISHSVDPFSFLRSTGMYFVCVVLLALLAFMRTIPFWLPLTFVGIYFVYLGVSIAVHFKKPRDRRVSLSLASMSLENVEARQKVLEGCRQLSLLRRFGYSLRITCWDDTWNSSTAQTVLRLLLLAIKAPISLILNCTILPLEIPEDHPDHRQWVSLRFLHRLRCVVNPPLSLLLYILLLGPPLLEIPWYIWSIYGATSLGLSIALWLSTSWGARSKLFPLHVLYSFCTCILWIYATSSELVSCLSSTGAFLGVSPTVMGILVLAWGNSFGDLVADIAIAKNGAFETAVTAILSGPVQNVLLTIGAGFLVAALQNPHHSVLVSSLRFDIYFALVVLAIVILSLLILVPFKFDFMIPRNFGFVLLTVYMLYLPCALLLGLGFVKLPFIH
ncbi:hypothetical protein PSACC_00315 [Paramicrosporidium saccamoebae]|uniref:Sodium/calcium exchanger membrane region domain-containing protein n=1 Tax=Paramicrosporidium saccamoebae TaxID=1246581 RepID=A0A2H9TQ24_9FUNG|nr:hypothetical protein PSACC_00315 [Paramicrosporidium saccamoebae]